MSTWDVHDHAVTSGCVVADLAGVESPAPTAATLVDSDYIGSESDEFVVRDRADLHVHLNGAVPLATIQEILSDEATELPSGFEIERDLVRRLPSPSLAAYLTPWQVLRLLPRRRENLDRLTDAAFAGFARNAVRVVELRSSVLYLAGLQNVSPADAMQALIESTGEAARRHKIRRGIILTVTRGADASRTLSTLLGAYRALGEPPEVVGIDLAGDEETDYPADLPGLFREAKNQYALGVTIHAGETGRAESIRVAVEQFGADRIGHGSAAGKDPQLMDLLASRDICVEVCPVSNRLTGALHPDSTHPLVEFNQRGTPFVICSDNPGIHDRGLSDDYAQAVAEGLPAAALNRQYESALRYSFMKDVE